MAFFGRDDWTALVLWTLLPFLASAASTLWVGGMSAVRKYYDDVTLDATRRSLFWGRPPGWLFGLMWIITYAEIGVSSFLIVNTDDGSSSLYQASIALYLVQLFLTMIWMPVFFGFETPIGGLVVLVFIILFVIATAVLFFIYWWVPGLLFTFIYVFWLFYALYINSMVVHIQRTSPERTLGYGSTKKGGASSKAGGGGGGLSPGFINRFTDEAGSSE